jgi:hypothetical protein
MENKPPNPSGRTLTDGVYVSFKIHPKLHQLKYPYGKTIEVINELVWRYSL